MAVKDAGRQQEVYNDVLTFDQSFIGSLAKTTGGTYDPVTETTTGATTTTTDIACVFKKVSKNDSIPENFILTDTQNYRAVTMATKGVIPGKNAIPTLLGQKYSILGSTESSGGDDALFTVYVKKGSV